MAPLAPSLATPLASTITVRPALLLMGHVPAIGTRYSTATCPDTFFFVNVSDVRAINTSSVMKRCTSLPASVIHVHQHDCSVLGVAVASGAADVPDGWFRPLLASPGATESTGEGAEEQPEAPAADMNADSDSDFADCANCAAAAAALQHIAAGPGAGPCRSAMQGS